jgi:hypothetical protein
MTVARATHITKRRKLAELFERGGEVRFNADGVNDGEPLKDDIVVWVRPPSPLERDQSLREATATRARAVLAAKRNPDEDPDSVTVQGNLAAMEVSDLIDFLLAQETGDHRQEANRRVLAEEEWEDFEALRDSMRQWEEEGFPETEEWQPLIDRDAEFGRQVDAAFEVIEAAAREAYELMSRPVLEKKVYNLRIEAVGNQAFMKTYQEQMLYFACRDGDDHSLYFFENVRELNGMPEEVQDALANKLASFIQNPADAKNSPGAAPGSASSEPPAKQETSEASIPEVVTA